MPDYRNIRLELGVYEELKARMLPMESMSELIRRLLDQMNEIAGHAQAIIQVRGGDKSWTTKQ